jgi:type II secretory pathway component PulK
MNRDGGFALIAVLLVMAMVGVIGAEFAYSMRLEAASVRAYKDSLVASHLAEAAVEQAIREIAGEGFYVAADDDGALTFYTRDRRALKRLPREKVPLGAGHFSYRLTDEEARMNLNAAPPDRVSRLLEALGIDKIERDTVISSIQDWRDPNEDHRLNGAESEDTYLKLPVPYRSKNANLDSVNELVQIKGVTAAMLAGVDGRPGLADVVTVKTSGQVNINTAGPVVMRALNISDAEYTEIVQSRRETPYLNVGRFGNRGSPPLSVTTRTFRVDAEGLLEGHVRARITAILQKRADGGTETVAVLEWSGVR